MSSKKSTKRKGSQSLDKKRKAVLTQDKEKAWYIPPSNGIPKYDAENDPFCPVGKIKKFNDEQKLKLKESIKGEKRSESWIKATIDRQYKDVPLRINVGLRTKALEVAVSNGPLNQPPIAEVEILQKILVRERLLNELTKLIKAGSDILAIMGEVIELIKALRFETLEIIEDIVSWQLIQPTMRPFIYKGMNYLVKIASDLDFLDAYDDIVEKFCFEFKSNPLAYRGGGNLISGHQHRNNEYYLKGLLKSYYDSGNTLVDGIEVVRLHNAEKAIQNEFDRISEMAKAKQIYGEISSPESLPGGYTIESPGGELIRSAISSSIENLGFEASSSSKKKPPKLFNPKKVKQERISVLKEEAGELAAMMSHIQEKILTFEQQKSELETNKGNLELRLNEAKATCKEVASMHIAAEISYVHSQIIETKSKIKDLTRENYFIGLERKRKLGVVRKMVTEIEEEKKRNALKKKIEAKIKKEGLLAALKDLNLNSTSTQSLELAKSKHPISQSSTTKVDRKKYLALEDTQEKVNFEKDVEDEVDGEEDGNDDDDDDDVNEEEEDEVEDEGEDHEEDDVEEREENETTFNSYGQMNSFDKTPHLQLEHPFSNRQNDQYISDDEGEDGEDAPFEISENSFPADIIAGTGYNMVKSLKDQRQLL